MKKIIKLLLVCTVFLTCFSYRINAFSAKDHGKIYHKVLFGYESISVTNDKDKKEALDLLDAASALAIDHQDKTKNKKIFELLKNNKIKYLPDTIEEISYEGSRGRHRIYTHLGWDNQITELDKQNKKDLARFETRKKFLMSTVNKVLSFSVLSDFNFIFVDLDFDKKCESFAAFTYYVHILGDYLEHEEYATTVEDMIPFASKKTSKNPTLISELKKHIEILFVDQKDSSKYYKRLMDGIDKIDRKASRYCGHKCNKIENNYDNIRNQAEELEDLLITYVPKLLKKEKFFNKVFY